MLINIMSMYLSGGDGIVVWVECREMGTPIVAQLQKWQ